MDDENYNRIMEKLSRLEDWVEPEKKRKMRKKKKKMKLHQTFREKMNDFFGNRKRKNKK